MRSSSPAEQAELREGVRGESDYYSLIATTYFANPFFRLTDDERTALERSLTPPGLRDILRARDAASTSTSPKFAVFCMPKSGSSFVQSALQHALELPLVTLTGIGTGRLNSHYGMNAREQELDEMAIAKAVVMNGRGFVAQHHTRHTAFLALQLRYFGIRPIVTFRNLLDCIVSFDDMMCDWRKAAASPAWINDAQFALPANYPELDPKRRYNLLARSYGVWLIQFYLSWMRGVRHEMVSPVILRYEDHVLDPGRFVDTLSGRLALTTEQAQRLLDYAKSPDRAKSRLNVGRSGRGRESAPPEARDFLLEYANHFNDEISDEEVAYLIG